MKKCFWSVVAILVMINCFSQSDTYYDKQWQNVSPATQVSFVSSNRYYAENRVPEIEIKKNEILQGWIGEKVNTQILVWTKNPINKLELSFSNFKDNQGQTLPNDFANFNFLKYVWSDGYYGNSCHPRELKYLDSIRIPDILDNVKQKPLDAKMVQPIWLSFQIPQNASAGIYQGKIIIKASKEYTLDITIQVVNQRLPKQNEWKFDLDLWQYPIAIAQRHKVTAWSNQHFELMKPYYELLASAGQKVITAQIIQEESTKIDYERSLIKWRRTLTGKWEYDYSLFDKYVSFVMTSGIKNQINCYSLLPWSYHFTFYDEQARRDSTITLKPTEIRFYDIYYPMLVHFAKHLKEKGWFDITTLAMDERKLNDMLPAIKVIKESDSDWKITLAGGYHPELIKDIFDYSLFKSHSFTKDDLMYRNARKMKSTFYTSCEGEKPNMFVFSSPAESRWMGWFAAAKNFTGYLRWAYNNWSDRNPILDARGIFPSGDHFLIYPGPLSSVRFEKLIEGIQDFEKIKIIYQKSNMAIQIKIDTILATFQNEILDTHSADEIIKQAEINFDKLITK